MVLWFGWASVASIPLGTGGLSDVLHEELICVAYQLLGEGSIPHAVIDEGLAHPSHLKDL